jgi:hypothetical protein
MITDEDQQRLDDLIVDTIKVHDALFHSRTETEFDRAQEQARQLLVEVMRLRSRTLDC